MRNEEEFFAWLDGELQGEAAERVAAEVASDPELQRLAEQHRALNTGLRGAFAPVAEASVPIGLAAAADRKAEVVDLAEARTARAERTRPALWKQAAALAATLVLAIAAANTLFTRQAVAPVEYEAGRLVASAELEDALYARLASAPAEDGPRIGLTFRDGAGAVCRTFTDRGASGLACRSGGDWQIRGLFQAPEGQQSDYRMAAGTDPQLAALIEQTMAGEPLDAAEEKAALERGWR